MTISITLIEFIWVSLNLSAFIFTVAAFMDARADARAVKLLNGHARELAANGVVRREGLRLIMQTLLLAAVLPLALSDRPVTLTPTILFLMAVPGVILTSSIFDARDRRNVTAVLAADILLEREESYQRYKAEHDAIAADAGARVLEAVQTIHDVTSREAEAPPTP